MSSKSKSALSETPNSKPSVPTSRISRTVSRTGRGVAKPNADSASLLSNSPRVSTDRSPVSVASNASVDRRSPKLGTPPEKKITRIVKQTEIQAELNLAQEDLKKAKDKLSLVEKEKIQALDELKEAQKLAEEANGKLRDALAAQKRAEEDSEIEKFRALEMEQVGIEATQRKEEERQKELEAVKNQHAIDMATLLSANEELHRVKQELAATCDAKNQALVHADDATKLAEVHAEKVKAISDELAQLKSELDTRTKMEVKEGDKFVEELKSEIDFLRKELEKAKSFEDNLAEKEAALEQLNVELEAAKLAESRTKMEAKESDKFVEELKSEIDSLRKELEKAKSFEDNLAEKEAALEQLNVELEAAKLAESYARNLLEELHERVDEVGFQAEQAKKLERSASESLESVIKQLEGSNDALHDARSEISSLKEKISLLEISVRRQTRDLEESECLIELAKKEALVTEKEVESVRSELNIVKEEKLKAMNNEKLAATSIQSLLEEKKNLVEELEASRDEEEKSKKALESLASALHEVSSEARDSKEKLLSIQVEHENYETQVEDLKLVLKATNEKYESMLDDAKHEIDTLTSSVDKSKHDFESLNAEWEEKELHLLDSVKECKEENLSMENDINRLSNLLKMAEKEASALREDVEHWESSYKKSEAEIDYLKEVLGEAKAESMKLKEGLMDKENELQSIIHENEELKKKEEASAVKVEELSMLLEEAMAKKKEEESEFQSVMHENKELKKREEASVIKVEELSKLLEDALAKKKEEENGELTDSEKDYDMLPKVVEFSEENGVGDIKPLIKENEEKHGKVTDVINDGHVERKSDVEKPNEKIKENEEKEKEDEEVDFKMWESCKIEEKDFAPEAEQEQVSFEDEMELKDESGEIDDVTNKSPENGGSATKQLSQKKKKPLFGKFGGLLKKKSSPSSK